MAAKAKQTYLEREERGVCHNQKESDKYKTEAVACYLFLKLAITIDLK